MKQEAQKSKSTETATPTKSTKTGKSPKVELLTLTEKDKKMKGDIPKGMKGLPSHWGPKVRHKQRPGQQGQKKGGKKGQKGKQTVTEGQKGKGKQVKNEEKRRNIEGGEEVCTGFDFEENYKFIIIRENFILANICKFGLSQIQRSQEMFAYVNYI